MGHYSWSSNRKHRSRRRVWVYVWLAVLVIAVVKLRTRGPNTAFGFGDNETESAPTVNDTGADSANTSSGPRHIHRSESDQTAEPTSRSAAESREGSPLEREDATEWDSPETLASTLETTPESKALIAEINSLVNAKPARIIEARDKLNEMLSTPLNRQQSAFAKKQLSSLAEKWLFGRAVLHGDALCGNYEVAPGERLGSISREFKVPYQILMQINNIRRPEALRAGETIKVINGPFHARICLSTFNLDLYLQNTFVRSFPVSLGREGRETPTGLWRAKPGGKLISPMWTDPNTGRTYQGTDSDYPLGSRWIGLEGLKGAARDRTGFAIHGTKNSDQIGQAVSRGCIRMNDKDVILMYDLLAPGLSQVLIVE